MTDSREHPVYKKVDALKGKFAFTSDDYDTFHICFTNVLRDGQFIFYCAFSAHFLYILPSHKRRLQPMPMRAGSSEP